MELKDKIIVVTGAASGIGRAMCIRYAAEGAKAVATGGKSMAAKLKGGSSGGSSVGGKGGGGGGGG